MAVRGVRVGGRTVLGDGQWDPMLIFLAVLSALVVGALSWLLIGPTVAAAVAVLMLIGGLVAQFGDRSVRRPIGTVLLLALLAGGTYGTIVAVDLVEALTTTDGTVDMADQSQLASAEDKLEGLAGQSSFQLELTEPELQAVVQDGLAAADDVPVRRVDLDLRGATSDVGFRAVFKAGGVEATGNASIAVVDGGIDLELGPLEFGSVQVPSLAAGAIQSLLGAVTDLNAALEDQQAVVQSITVTDDALIVTGTRGTDEVLTDGDLLAAIRDQATGAIDAVQAPPERIGQGRLAGLDEPGEPIVLAIGDSLAANVGVDDNRDGFVSRFHRFVADADGVPYGLVNLGVPGETSGSLLTGGQLEAAEAVLASRPAAYVVVDIGANDLALQAHSGLMSITGGEGGPPARAGSAIVDLHASLAIVSGVLAALFHRERTGEGQRLDTSLLLSSAHLMSYFYQDYWLTGNEHRRMGTANHLSVPNQAFPANDGYVVIIAPSDEMWRRLAAALDPETLGVETFRTASERLRLRKDVVEAISAITRVLSKHEIHAKLSRAKVNVSIVNGIGEATGHPQLEAVGGVFHHGDGERYVGTPFRLHKSPGRMTRGYPGLGEHTAEILSEAGFSEAEIQELSGEWK